MAAGNNKQIPIPSLIRPPAATPRRRSPISVQPDNFDEVQSSLETSRLYSPRVDKDENNKVISDSVLDLRQNAQNEKKTNLSSEKAQALINTEKNAFDHTRKADDLHFTPPSTKPSSEVSHPDLVGLDFSGSLNLQIATYPLQCDDKSGEERLHMTSSEGLQDYRHRIYPDIRQAFSGLTNSQALSSSTFAANSYKGYIPFNPTNAWTCSTPPLHLKHEPTVYSWNTFNPSNQGRTTSTLSSTLPYFSEQPFSRINNASSSNTTLENINFRPQNNLCNNFSSDSSGTGLVNLGDSYVSTVAAYDINPLNREMSSNMASYVPNISLQRPTSLNVSYPLKESPQSPTDNQINATVVAGLDGSIPELSHGCNPEVEKDLIKLGQSSEHEYLSLDYFDPLYSRARRESVCPGHDRGLAEKNTQFSFGEAFPNLCSDPLVTETSFSNRSDNLKWPFPDQQSIDHTWEHRDESHHFLNPSRPVIGFEAFDLEAVDTITFGESKSELKNIMVDTAFRSPAYDGAPKSDYQQQLKDKPPSLTVPQGKIYERLRKRTFIDQESESFCQMVADLKKKYLSTDEKTNQGYLINQMREFHLGCMQVKIVVHTRFASDPVSFTCDTGALVEHVISHVLCTLSPGDCQISTDKFILKVYDRSEYLCNDLPLAKFEYIHNCLKLDRDICLELQTLEEVCRPFIRTKDDDAQILYFPKEYINANGTAVSQETLAVYIDTFYHEVETLIEHLTQGGGYSSFSVNGLQQSVKDICDSLARIETVEITKVLGQLHKCLSELNSPSANAHSMFGQSQDKETQDAINVAVRCSFVEDMKKNIDHLVIAVKKLVRMYCQTFLTDFFLGPSITIPHDHLEVVQLQEFMIVCISSAHRIPTTWMQRFEEYKIVCSLYHGSRRLAPDISTSLKGLTQGLCERIYWDEWLQFDKTYLCTIPRETRLCLMLCGTRSTQLMTEKTPDKGDVNSAGKCLTYPLGAAAIQLFNEKGYLNQGPQLIPLMMGAGSDPIMPSCKTLLPDSILLQVNLPDFERTIFFPEPLNAATSPTRSFDLLTPKIQSMVKSVMERESCLTFAAEELEILWAYRHYMTNHPALLPRILQAAVSWDWASLSEIYALLRIWKPLLPVQAFELLLPQFPDVRVREFAAISLDKITSDDLIDFLPQMIQGLKFESYHNSPLAKLLLEQSCKSPRFAHQFFWLLKGAASQDATFKRRYELMFVALASVTGDALYQEFKKQEELVKIMTHVAEKVKGSKDKEATLKQELVSLHNMVENKGRLLLPYNPSVEVIGLDMKSCSYFTSNAFPLKLVFKNSNTKADSHYVIYKVGDDLRQDMLTLQMIRIMDNLWLQHGLDLKMITYACLTTGPKKGVIELITESETLRKIQTSYGVTGSFKDRPIKEWLQKHNPTELEYKKAVENFTYSCAGYCVATYVLGICDRHNDNIMLKQSGHMFHIDFSKFLGDAQMFGSFKRDRVPFVLTSDMAHVINDGGRPGQKFQVFIDLCCQAFNILRKQANLFRSLFILMSRSGIPGVTEEAAHYVENTLLPGDSDAQATANFTRMIEESMKSVFTQFNFFIHNLAQMKFSSHTEGALLSFVPKTYSIDTDGKISCVELFGYQKRYSPDKHYIFIVKIEREQQKVPTYIFRHFSEFIELRDKLSEMFPLVTWPNFSTRLVIGRSNIRSVAESRKTEISSFLRFLWNKTAEISQCELVYTFFHPLLRDEQEADKAQLKLTKLREPSINRMANSCNSGIQGQIKMSLQYRKNALQVLIMHVRGLHEGSQLPSPYVKTYLLPDPDKVTKLKTKTVRNSSHPTFNELLQYQLPRQEILYRVLQITVWDRDMLKENNFLGAVYIRLRDLNLDQESIGWHSLGRIQMSHF